VVQDLQLLQVLPDKAAAILLAVLVKMAVEMVAQLQHHQLMR
jgi:hypothetical protein